MDITDKSSESHSTVQRTMALMNQMVADVARVERAILLDTR